MNGAGRAVARGVQEVVEALLLRVEKGAPGVLGGSRGADRLTVEVVVVQVLVGQRAECAQQVGAEELALTQTTLSATLRGSEIVLLRLAEGFRVCSEHLSGSERSSRLVDLVGLEDLGLGFAVVLVAVVIV